MEDIIFAIIISSIVAFMLSNIFAIIYNVFVGFPKGRKIKKNKDYKTVTATRIIHGGNGFTEMMNGDSDGTHKNVFEYEWEVDSKRYRRIIRTKAWPSAVDTFYYHDDPKYAMPLPEELARFRHTKGLFAILFVIVFLITLSK